MCSRWKIGVEWWSSKSNGGEDGKNIYYGKKRILGPNWKEAKLNKNYDIPSIKINYIIYSEVSSMLKQSICEWDLLKSSIFVNSVLVTECVEAKRGNACPKESESGKIHFE